MESHDIDYVAFPSADLHRTKAFFVTAFGWDFGDCAGRTVGGACLILSYSEALETSLTRFDACEARIVKPIFAFPAGRRFHFEEWMGNEFAVWSNKQNIIGIDFLSGKKSCIANWMASHLYT